jgi:MFS transporter, DHA2 family, methylenomycin A resistance protein
MQSRAASIGEQSEPKQQCPGRENAAVEHDPEKWKPVFGKRSCANKKLERNDDSKKSHPAPALGTLCLAVLIAQLDTSIVNLAVQPIGRYFAASVAELQWIIDGYNLSYAVLLLTGGLLADLYGRRLVFMTGAAVFVMGSLCCAAAPNVAVLVGGRALAGIGAALLLPASLALIAVVWPDPVKRSHALGIWAACNGLSFVIGPTVGGLLIQQFGWRSIFVVVVPLGAAAVGLAVPALPESSDRQGRAFDAPAQILGAAILGGLALAAIEAREVPLAALAAGMLAAVALPLFWSVERRRGTAALMPLDLFRILAFRGAILATAGMTFGMYGVLFLLPMTWQSEGLLSPVGAGLALVPMAAIFAVISPFSGVLTAKFGARATTSGGVALIGAGLCILAAAADQRTIAPAVIGLSITGLGMGVATGPLFAVAVGAVATARSGTAAALINVARMVGATIGVAILGSVFAWLGGGAAGLRLAMLLGGVVQLAGAALAWIEGRRAP